MNRFDGLWVVNVELTSRCNKNCWMCGRRKIERDFPKISMHYGDMDFELVESIAGQLPNGIVVQLHFNGEPLLYPRFGEAAKLFKRQIRCMDTNGKLIVQKADEIIGNLDTLTISTFQGDREADEQYDLLKNFLKIKGDRKPNVIIRCLGDMDIGRYKKLDCLIATRIMHSPMGSFTYRGKPTIPEIGICLDILGHLVIKSNGRVSVCVRFDPFDRGVIGNCNKTNLSKIWNGQLRRKYLRLHIEGKRDGIPQCKRCEFWGFQQDDEMRVLLVIYDNESYIPFFPQGPAYIAAILKVNGIDVEIYNQDYHHYPKEHLTEYLNKNRFDVIGLGIIAGYYQYKKLLQISDAINKQRIDPTIFSVVMVPPLNQNFSLKKQVRM